MKLIRDTCTVNGVLGQLLDESGTLFCQTMEHAYMTETGAGPIYAPKIPTGTYLCIRGQHQLEGMATPFTTFEITGVPGHTGCLFHCGNTEADSSGCVLVGMARQGVLAVLESRAAFGLFMEKMAGIDSFELTVT